MPRFFYNDLVRLDWGFGNPNVTGSLIALIMLSLWVLPYLPRAWGTGGFWLALLINLVLGMCLVQTFSRGAAASFVIGAAVLIGFAPRPWSRVRGIGVVLAGCALIGYAFHLGFTERSIRGLLGDDRSVTNRWLIYKVVPRMMLDAPEGWGHERGGEAFVQWYQPVGRRETYVRLVNSHATWLVEWPWSYRLGYITAWVGLGCFLMPGRRLRRHPPSKTEGGAALTNEASAKKLKAVDGSAPQRSCETSGPPSRCINSPLRFPAVALAVWAAFFVGASFTTTAHRWQMWLIPGAVLVLVLIGRLVRRDWPGRYVWAGGGMMGSLMVAGLLIGGSLTPSELHMQNGAIAIGKTDATTTWLFPGIDKSVQGQFYGHKIRKRCRTNAERCLVRWTPDATLPEAPGARLVCPGIAATEAPKHDRRVFENAKEIQFINPDQPAPWLVEMAQSGRLRARCKLGAFAQGPANHVWESLAQGQIGIEIVHIEGKGRYVPDLFD